MATFNGERLRQARQLKKINIQEFAEVADLSRQIISQYESGRSIPSDSKVEDFSKLLDFPLEFFYVENDDIKVLTTFFRSQITTPKAEKESQIVKIELILTIFEFLKNYIEFPSQNIPLDESAKDIKKAANALREAWGLGDGPIHNLLAHAENNGVFATSLSTGNEKIDAFSINTRAFGVQTFIMALGNEKASGTRRNFNIAHELGHLVLNHYEDGETALIEDEANSFAAEFLLPEEQFTKDLLYPTKLDSYVDLKRKWHVSISAMIIRSFNLGVISKSEYQNLMRSMNIRKWRVKEPLDDSIVIEEPYSFKLAVEMLLDNKIFTTNQFMDELKKFNLPVHHYLVEELLGLEINRLKPLELNKVKLKLIK